MYKINECDIYKNNSSSRNINKNKNTSTSTKFKNTNVKLVEDDLQKLSILPKYCPMYTKSFHDYFNDGATLNPVVPYKYTTETNPNGGLQTKMEYNVFYSDTKLDSLKSPQTLKHHSSEYEDISGKTKYEHIPNSLLHRYTEDNPFSKHFSQKKLNIKPDTLGFQGFDSFNQLSDYNNSALKHVKDLYSSVFEDMYIMGYKSNPKADNIDKNIGYRYK